MTLQDHIDNLASMNEIQAGLIANYIKPYIQHNEESLTAMDGYQLALISQNMRFYHRILIASREASKPNEDGTLDMNKKIVGEEDMKFLADFETLLGNHIEALPEVIKTFNQEMAELEKNDPQVYKDFMEVLKKKS